MSLHPFHQTFWADKWDYDGSNLGKKELQLFRILSFIYEMQSQFLKKTNIYMQYSFLYYNQPVFSKSNICINTTFTIYMSYIIMFE